jgi:hypothetical protein
MIGHARFLDRKAQNHDEPGFHDCFLPGRHAAAAARPNALELGVRGADAGHG